jgi:hypothetical protein
MLYATRLILKLEYNLYFNLLYKKIKYYGILPSNTYNIDKKGFIIGITDALKESSYSFNRRQNK